MTQGCSVPGMERLSCLKQKDAGIGYFPFWQMSVFIPKVVFSLNDRARALLSRTGGHPRTPGSPRSGLTLASLAGMVPESQAGADMGKRFIGE